MSIAFYIIIFKEFQMSKAGLIILIVSIIILIILVIVLIIFLNKRPKRKIKCRNCNRNFVTEAFSIKEIMYDKSNMRIRTKQVFCPYCKNYCRTFGTANFSQNG